MTTITPDCRHGSMQDAEVAGTEILLPAPKRFVRETLIMPDGVKLDWYFVDTPPSVMVVPVLPGGGMILVRQYRHNLKCHTLEFPAGAVAEDELPEAAARRELEEETGFTMAAGGVMRPLGAYYSLPSETNKYTHVFLAESAMTSRPPLQDAEIEKYFDMNVVIMPPSAVAEAIGDSVTGAETITAFMLARKALGQAATATR